MKSNITFLINASFSRQCPKTWRRRAMIFVFTDCWEVIFWRKKRGKTPIFRIYRPYRTRPGTGKTCSLHVTPPVEIRNKGYFDVPGSEVYISEFTVWAHWILNILNTGISVYVFDTLILILIYMFSLAIIWGSSPKLQTK